MFESFSFRDWSFRHGLSFHDQNFRSLSFRGHPFVSTEKLSALEKLKPDAEEIHFCSTTTSLKELFYVTGTISVSQFFVNVQ